MAPMLEKLGESLKSTLQKIAKSVFVDDKLINELVKDIQRALLQADVNVKLVLGLTEQIRQRIRDEKTPAALTKKEHLINIVYEELVRFLGGEKTGIALKTPHKIMLVGLFGSGKTTTAGKLAKYYTKRGRKVLLVQTDTWRPAAYEQLQTLAGQAGAMFHGIKNEKDPLKILKGAGAKADIVILDTAGRDALSDDLIGELRRIAESFAPDDNLLVLSADIGQAAMSQAQKFHETCSVTGVIITKLDGTARGGGALSACTATSAGVKFIGTGERIDDMEEFRPKGFVGRLLGMGDLEALLEKARSAITEEQAEDLSKRLLKGDFNLIDLYEQMQAMQKMGSLGKLMEMIPGFGQMKLPKDVLNVQEEKLKIWKHAMNSFTKDELEDPQILTGKRIERIARGSGTSTGDIRELIKQYRMGRKLVKGMKGANVEKLMKRMQKR